MGVNAAEGSGLAYLVHSAQRPAGFKGELSDLVEYVFDLKPSPEASGSGELDYKRLQQRINSRAAQVAAEAAAAAAGASSSATTGPCTAKEAASSAAAAAAAAAAGPSSSSSSSGGSSSGEAASSESGSSSSPSTSSGRLGPRVVAIDEASVQGQFSYGRDGLLVESLGNFTSCRANVAVFKGKWQYEATVLTPGIQQIGWATLHCPFTAEEGVGDAPDSYAIDGKRVRKWSVKPQPYGKSWVQGDVIGCLIDLDAGTLSFTRNGQSLGVAYTNVRTMQPHLAYFPALSCSKAERCHLNFGGRPLVYPQEGYLPLQQQPTAEAAASAAYYCSCLGRLVQMSSGAASSNTEPISLSPQPSSPPCSSIIAGCPFNSSLQRAPGGAAGAGVTRSTTSSCSGKSSGSSGGGSEALYPRAQLPGDQQLLLAACALGPLQQLLAVEGYLVHSCLLPLLQELYGSGEPHRPQLLRSALQLLQLVFTEELFVRVMREALHALSVRCQISGLASELFPYTASYPPLSLAVGLLSFPPVSCLALGDPYFLELAEGLLARKASSSDDLKALLPQVWWPGTTDETCSEERWRASLNSINTTLVKVEERQYELFCLLASWPAPGSTPKPAELQAYSSNLRHLLDQEQRQQQGGAAEGGVAQREGEGAAPKEVDPSALLYLLRFLLHKNSGSLMDVQPPGLSDATVLMSAFFALLRMVQPALAAAGEGHGPLAAFPAAATFAVAASAASSPEAEVIQDMPRFGGLLSFMMRETPLSAADKAPLPVAAPRPLQPTGPDPQLLLPAGVYPELLVGCLLLYSWRVGLRLRTLHSLAGQLSSNAAKLAEVERALQSHQAPEGGQTTQWLLDSRAYYREELGRDMRILALLRTAFFSPSKQAALFTLVAWVSGLLLAASQCGPLLAYLPCALGELVMDYVLAGRRCEAPWATPEQLQEHGAQLLVSLLAATINSPHICNPDVKEALLQTTGALLDTPGWVGLFEANPAVQQQMMPALMAVFDGRLWHPASNLLLSIIRHSGFGQRTAGPACLTPLQQQLTAQCRTTAATLPGFLHRLFSTLNWTLTEFTSSLSDLAAQRGGGSRLAMDAQQKYRRTILMFEMSCNLLRILEFVVVQGSDLFLEGPAVNRDRLLELLQFVLAHFTAGGGAKRLNDLLQPPGAAAAAAATAPVGRADAVGAAAAAGTSSSSSRQPAGSGPSSSSTAAAADSGNGAANGAANGVSAAASDVSTSSTGSSRAGAAAAAPGAPEGSSTPAGSAPAAAGGSSHGALAPAAAAAGVAPAAPPAAPQQPPAAAAGGRRERTGADPSSRLVRDLLSARIEKASILAPVVGMLLGLQEAGDTGLDTDVAQAGAAGTAPSSCPDGGSSSSSSSVRPRHAGSVLGQLAQEADARLMERMQFLQDMDWCAAFPAVPLSDALRRLALLLEALRAAHQALQAAAAAGAAAGGAGTGAPGDGAAAAGEEPPEEFMDPITMSLMSDPVRLPDSGVTLDRSTVQRHLLNSATDPFSRAPLTLEQVVPDTQLAARITAWQQERCRARA